MSGPRWAAARLKALERDGWRCRKCGRAGRLEVDHVKPRVFGGAVYELSNLMTLCRDCHIAKTRADFNLPPTPKRDKWRKLVRDMVKGFNVCPNYIPKTDKLTCHNECIGARQ